MELENLYEELVERLGGGKLAKDAASEVVTRIAEGKVSPSLEKATAYARRIVKENLSAPTFKGEPVGRPKLSSIYFLLDLERSLPRRGGILTLFLLKHGTEKWVTKLKKLTGPTVSLAKAVELAVSVSDLLTYPVEEPELYALLKLLIVFEARDVRYPVLLFLLEGLEGFLKLSLLLGGENIYIPTLAELKEMLSEERKPSLKALLKWGEVCRELKKGISSEIPLSVEEFYRNCFAKLLERYDYLAEEVARRTTDRGLLEVLEKLEREIQAQREMLMLLLEVIALLETKQKLPAQAGS